MLGPSELARFLIPSSVCCDGVARITASDHATASSTVASAARGCSVSNGWYFLEAVFRTPYLLAVMVGQVRVWVGTALSGMMQHLHGRPLPCQLMASTQRSFGKRHVMCVCFHRACISCVNDAETLECA